MAAESGDCKPDEDIVFEYMKGKLAAGEEEAMKLTGEHINTMAGAQVAMGEGTKTLLGAGEEKQTAAAAGLSIAEEAREVRVGGV